MILKECKKIVKRILGRVESTVGVPIEGTLNKGEAIKRYNELTHGKNLNELEKFFFEEEHLPICKWVHYFDIYDRHFSKFREKEITIVEIGVFQGGSLQ